MEPQGLAAMGEMPMANSGISVEQVMQMIMQGVSPEELVAAGVPQELIDRAMMKLMSQMQPSNEEAGLAGMYMNE